MAVDYQETLRDLQTRIDIHSKYGGRDIDAWMLELLKPSKGAKILDVGCGLGKQLAAFHRYLDGDAEITGGDISKELLEKAEALSTDLGNAFRIMELDFDKRLPFDTDQFDLVSCCFALYYSADIPFTVGEMHRILRPDGCLFTTGPMPDNKRLFYEVIRDATGAEIPRMPGSSRYGTEILNAVQSTFQRVKVHVFENPVVFPEVEPFLEYTRASLSEDRKLWGGLVRNGGAVRDCNGKDQGSGKQAAGETRGTGNDEGGWGLRRNQMSRGGRL